MKHIIKFLFNVNQSRAPRKAYLTLHMFLDLAHRYFIKDF